MECQEISSLKCGGVGSYSQSTKSTQQEDVNVKMTDLVGNEKQTGKIFILNAASVRNRGFIRKENSLLQSEVQISQMRNM